MSIDRFPLPRFRRGLTLIELVIAIAIVGVAVAGVLRVLNLTTMNSVDPQQRKQALAIAEALLEEVQLMPFTTCDPDGFNPVTSACSLTEGMGAEPGEGRNNAATPFDNVNDYNNFTLNPGDAALGGLVTTPAGYTANVVVAQEAGGFGPAGAQVPTTEVLLITVTVTYATTQTVVLSGYRTRYAPTGS